MEPPSSLPFLGLLSATPNLLSLDLLIAMVVILLLLVCSALISGSEVAYFSLSPTDKNNLEQSKNKREQLILKLLEKPKELLATILIANNFINVGIVILTTYVSNRILIFYDFNQTLSFIVQVIGITFLILLFGEVIPKIYATNKSVFLAKIMSLPIRFIKRIFYPLSQPLVKSTAFIDKKIKKKGKNISVDDLENALELTEIEGVTQKEKEILEGIVKFGNTDVKQIMKSRVDVTAFDEKTTFEELKTLILEAGYSRIPIYNDSFDNVSGVLYVKDLLPHIDKDKFEWKKILRAPFFVPENKKIDDLLSEFQESKVHMAIVVDEYGGTSGIVTLEDIIEEIIGDITDEFDEDDLVYSKIDDHNYVFEGKTALIDVYRVLEIDGGEFEETKGESDTLAGFLIEHSGKILKKNEKVTFNEYTFTIEAADKRRIKQIKINIGENVRE